MDIENFRDGLLNQAHARSEAAGTATSGAMFVRPDRMAFEACRAQSIDYAVLEQHKDVAVVPFRGQWSDVGSWNAVADLMFEWAGVKRGSAQCAWVLECHFDGGKAAAVEMITGSESKCVSRLVYG